MEEAPKDALPTDVQNTFEELGHIVTTETAPPTQPSTNNNMSLPGQDGCEGGTSQSAQEETSGGGAREGQVRMG